MTQAVKVTVPIATRPKPIDLVDTRVYVVNQANLQKFIEDFEAENGDLAFVALSVKDYENLALNVSELRRFINQQKEIIFYYREATKPKGKEGWLEENEERQENQREAEEANNEQQYAPPAEQPTEEETGFSIKKLLPFGND